MAIPGGQFTTEPQVSDFIYPYNVAYTALHQTVLGGIAPNDASQGRNYQLWSIDYDGTDITVTPESGSTTLTITEPDVQSVSLSFNNNMDYVIAWTTPTGAKLYYYDTLTSQYITRTAEFTNITSCRVCVDKYEEWFAADSDVIFGYVENGNLYYRQQRDRYDNAYLIGPATGRRLIKMAPSVGNRLQFQLI